MARRYGRASVSRQDWAVQIAELQSGTSGSTTRVPVTVERIVTTALDLVKAHDYDALTMRALAGALDVVPGAIYVHVRDKASLGELMVGRVCSRIDLPEPDPSRWAEQATDVCRQLRDQLLEHPGLGRAALEVAPTSLQTLRVNEGVMAIMVAGGVPLRHAAWIADAAFLYVNAYCSVAGRRHGRSAVSRGSSGREDREELLERFAMLPEDLFPLSSGHPHEVLSGDGHERFDLAMSCLLRSPR